MKLSLVFSVLFCFYSIKLLLEERFEPIYEYSYDNLTKDKFDFRFCLDLKEFDIYANKSEVYLPDLKANLIAYWNTPEFHSKFSDGWDSLAWFFTEQINSKDCFVYKNQICLPMVLNEVRNKGFYEKILSVFDYKTTHFYLYENETFSLINVKSIKHIYSSKIDRLVVRKSLPYKDCRSTLNGQKYLSRSCLNNCFKDKLKLGKYYYDLNENTIIQLNYDENNDTIIESEQDCLVNQCTDKNCQLDRFLFDDVSFSFKTSRISYYIGRSLIPDLDYFIQFIGLILLFINISFYQIFSKIFEFIFTKIKKSMKMILIFEINMVLIFVIIIIVLLINFLNVYQENTIHPIKKQLMTRLIVPESFYYLICLEKISKIENKTLSELENDTRGMINNAVKNVYYQFDNHQQKIDYRFTNRVFLTFDYGYIERCFALRLDPQESIPHYRNLLSIPKLTIELNKIEKNEDNLMFSNFYLLPDDQVFNSKSYEHLNNVNFVKNKIKRSSKDDKCLKVRYSQKRQKVFKCKNQFDCLEKCRLRSVFRNTSKILTYRVFDNFYLADKLWKNIIIKGLTEIVDEDVEKKCRERFEKKECEENYFEGKIFSINSVDEFKREIDLYYDVIETIEEEPSKSKIILDVLNVQSILFGLNAMNLFLKISGVLNLKYNLKIKNHFIIHIILCAIGFCIHSYIIFNEIINSDLIKSQHYEMQNQIDPPDIVLCIPFNQKTIENPTYRDLDNITKDLKAEKIFEKISYLNKLNKWIIIDQSLNFTDENLGINTFYFLDKKCFKINLNIIYKRNQFLFEDNEQILRVSFNSTFVDDQKVLFFTKRKNKLHLSRISYYRPDYEIMEVEEEIFKVSHFDKYNQIKNFLENPLSLFYSKNYLNDADQYMNMLKEDFKNENNLTTLNLPLEDANDDLKINDESFETYVKDVQIAKDQDIPSNSNFEREYTAHHLNVTRLRGLRKDLRNESYNFAFKLKSSFFTVFIIETNADNWGKLLLNLLNLVTLWFGLNPVSFFALKTNLLGRSISNWAFKAKSKEENLEISDKKVALELLECPKNESETKPKEIKIINHLIKNRYQSIKDSNENIPFIDEETFQRRRERNRNLWTSQNRSQSVSSI